MRLVAVRADVHDLRRFLEVGRRFVDVDRDDDVVRGLLARQARFGPGPNEEPLLGGRRVGCIAGGAVRLAGVGHAGVTRVAAGRAARAALAARATRTARAALAGGATRAARAALADGATHAARAAL